jgi:hypothetical protein
MGKKSTGLGDDIEKLIKFTGLNKLVESDDGEECTPCQRRKKVLNKIFPYKNNQEPLIPSNDEFTPGKYIFMKNSVVSVDNTSIPYKIGDTIFVKSDNPKFRVFKNLYKLGVIKHTI